MDEFDETMKDIKDNLIARIQRQEKEIQDLKANLEMYENGVYFSSQVDELQARIDKAIEYLREIEMFEKKFGFDGERRKKLLNILQGSDKE